MSPARQTFEKLLRQLHIAMREDNESVKANELRDAMDAPWYQMTEQEQDETRKLSGDLYDEEP